MHMHQGTELRLLQIHLLNTLLQVKMINYPFLSSNQFFCQPWNCYTEEEFALTENVNDTELFHSTTVSQPYWKVHQDKNKFFLWRLLLKRISFSPDAQPCSIFFAQLICATEIKALRLPCQRVHVAWAAAFWTQVPGGQGLPLKTSCVANLKANSSHIFSVARCL